MFWSMLVEKPMCNHINDFFIKELLLEISGSSYSFPGTTVGWSTSKDQFMDISGAYFSL